jgi:hypothetical protein
MYGQASGIGSFANRFELLLHPGQGFCEQDSRFLCRCTAVFLQFGTQVPTGQPLRAKASRFLILMSTNPQRHSFGEFALLRSCNKFLNRETRSSTMRRQSHLGLEVIVDVAQRNLACFAMSAIEALPNP